ncbi:hypothetical protein CK1_29060 [Ruminococcus sp. SR1/5]|jgi:hypothetical protein|nr:hypothetical protein CK1_29060 [Ruminococcus sp. SR1/5]
MRKGIGLAGLMPFLNELQSIYIDGYAAEIDVNI